MRYFEAVEKKYIKNSSFLEEIKLPERSTKNSAGYDFFLNQNGLILCPGLSYFIWTDVKVKLEKNEVLLILIRSSLALKKGLSLVNPVGVIDSDYSNKENDGNICFCIKNNSSQLVEFSKYEKIGQGIIINYLKTFNDKEGEERVGGIGSTG